MENLLISSRIFSQHFSVCSKHDISRFWTFFSAIASVKYCSFWQYSWTSINWLCSSIVQWIPCYKPHQTQTMSFLMQLGLLTETEHHVWVPTPFFICSNHFVQPIKNKASWTVGSCMRRRSSKGVSLRRGPYAHFAEWLQNICTAGAKLLKQLHVLSDVEQLQHQCTLSMSVGRPH